MTSNSYHNRFADLLIKKISSHTPLVISFYTTVFVLSGSIPTVYLFAKFFSTPYTSFLLTISIALPIILTPMTILLFIRLTKHLNYFQKLLKIEVEKNKAKDIMLFEQARFVLMGEMMANISHQWKQPLNTIGLCVVNARLSNGDETEKYFDIMEDNVNYLASTIGDFMSFFNQKTHTEIRNLEDILKEIKSIIHSSISSNDIRLNIEVNSNCSDVKISSSVSQVLLNILNNAKDAFGDKKDNKIITLRITSLENRLEIFCCDNAKGINPKIKDKIFDPYFTTKHKTQGTGIGLYMSKQIVQKVFGGNIDVNSLCSSAKECEDKTCFEITIPYSKNCILKKSQK